MNWRFIGQCTIYGLLCAIWTAGSSIYILPAMPDHFGWLKIGAACAVSFVGGIFLFTRSPDQAWSTLPGGK